jgi:transmembrane sensor
VQAIGTAFVVRRNDDELTVTLLEGKVRVVEPSGEAGVGSADPARNGFAAARQTPLSPGQRLTVTPSGGSTVDEPALDKVTAWRRGQVAIDDLSLAEAVREMNRYSPVKLVVADAAAGNLRVGGFFRIGDSRGFASAVAATYHLRLIEENDQIVMTTQ